MTLSIKTHICIVMLLLLFPTSIFSQEDTHLVKYIDSMMQIVNTTEGKIKIESLDNLTQRVGITNNGLVYMNMLEEEAKKQSNDIMLTNAYFYKANYNFFVTRALDSTLYYLNKARDIGLEDKDLRLTSLQIGTYMHDSKYASALLLIKEVLESGSIPKKSKNEGKLYGDLSNIYLILKNIDEAIVAGNRSIDILDSYASSGNDEFDFDTYFEAKLQALWALVDAYRLNDMYDDSINAADSILLLIDEANSRYIGKSHEQEWVVPAAYIRKAQTYLYMVDLQGARASLDSAKYNYPNMMYDYIRATYMFTEGIFYNRKGEYNKSLDYIDKGFNIIGEDKLDLNATINVHTLKSDNLHKLGRDTDAYALLKNILQKKDSIDKKQMSSQAAEMQTIYEVNKIKNDLEMQTIQLGRTQAIAVGLLCVLFLLSVIVFSIKRNKKEREKKNKKIYEQYLLTKSYLDQIRTQRDNSEAIQERINNKQATLIEHAYNYLIETEVFKDENLSRDDLAVLLGTNRQYLIDSIKAETGKTFRDYVNTIRLNYAHSMLIKDWDASIESVYLEVGFSSRSTFNRLFKDQYGMSPNELREVARQKEEHIISKGETLGSDI